MPILLVMLPAMPEKMIFSAPNLVMSTWVVAAALALPMPAQHTTTCLPARVPLWYSTPPFLKEYTGDPELIAAAEKACADAGVKALVGKIATGDLFVGDSATKAAIEAKCAPDCVEMEGAAVSQIAAKNGVPCVILRAMSDNADEDGHEVLVVKKFSISEYVATATKIVAAMVESL